MRVIIETIPHADQRYETVGDWLWSDDVLTVRVSKMADWRHMAAVAIHELVEAVLCKAVGLDQDDVDAFDLNFKGEGEPGDDPAAPYRKQHALATSIERMVVAGMGLDWNEYADAVDAL